MFQLTWLADVLRNEGLNVIEEPNWKNKGRAEMGEVKGIICHHTAGAKKGNTPSLGVVRDGRPDLPGPLSQLFLARDGTFHVMAAGRCNHAGAGNWQGVTQGNSHMIGIEAENTGLGDDPWPHAQLNAYVHGCAAICSHLGLDEVMVCGHKEYAIPKGRKTDPAFDMRDFRSAVGLSLHDPDVKYPQPKPTDPKRAMLSKGAMGDDVKLLQGLLQLPIDGNFGPDTEKAVIAFQSKHDLTADGNVGPKTWAALLGK